MKKFIALALVTLGVTVSARAQWVVFDPTAQIQSIINTAQEVAQFITMIQNQVQQIQSLTDQLNEFKHYESLFGDPKAVVLTTVQPLVTDLRKTELGQTLTALNDLTPAFSLYGGLLPGAAYEGGDHPDFRASHPGYLPTISYFYGMVGPREGGWNALDSFDMSNKASEQTIAANWKNGTLTYVGHAIDGAGVDVNGDRIVDHLGDGTADQMVSRTFRLGPGDYSVVIGQGGGNTGFRYIIRKADLPERK